MCQEIYEYDMIYELRLDISESILVAGFFQ